MMEKRLVLAILLSLLVLIFYFKSVTIVDKKKPSDEKKTAEPVPVRKTEKYEPETILSPVSAGEDILINTNYFRMFLSTRGALIKSMRLKQYDEKWKSRKELVNELGVLEKKIEKLADPEKEGASLFGRRKVLNYMIEEIDRRKLRTEELQQELKDASTGGDLEHIKDLEDKLNIEKGVELLPPEAACFGNYPGGVQLQGIEQDLDMIEYKASSDKVTLRDRREEASVSFTGVIKEGVTLTKKFSFSSDSYIIRFDLIVRNGSSQEIKANGGLLTYTPGVGFLEERAVRGATSGIVSYVDGKLNKERLERSFMLAPTVAPGESVIRRGEIGWTAIKCKYFTAVLIPGEPTNEVTLRNKRSGGQMVGLRIADFELSPGGSFKKSFRIYLGPQKREDLKTAGLSSGVGRSLERIIDYGRMQYIAEAIDFLLKKTYLLVGNYGWAIIILSLIIKVVFYPLTHRSFEGMRKMQEGMKSLEPQMKDLKEKYGNNQQKLNKATMELYRKEKVNPLSGCRSGCLPMLLQMPVFFALYAVLYNSIDLRGAPFIGWVRDLSAPDPFGILPILMGVSMFWQQKVTGMGGGAGTQQEQQKIMKWFFPIFLTFIFFRLSSGVVLYWFSFNVFTSLQQSLIKGRGSDKG